MIDAYMHLAQRDEDKIDVFSDKFDNLRGDDGIVKKNDLGEAYNVFSANREDDYLLHLGASLSDGAGFKS